MIVKYLTKTPRPDKRYRTEIQQEKVTKKEGIFFRRADGVEIPVKEVEGLKGNGLLIVILAGAYKEEDMRKVQQNIETRIGDGTRVLILDERVKEIMRLEASNEERRR